MKTICAYCEQSFDNADGMADHVMSCEKSPLVKMIKGAKDLNDRLTLALHEIANYDQQPIWDDDRDDAANAMLYIARQALGLEE